MQRAHSKTTNIAVALLVVVLSACGDNSPSSAASSSTSLADTTSSTASAPPLVELTDLPASNRRPMAWISATVIDDGKHVEVTYEGGQPECYPVDGEVTRGSNNQATVTLYVGQGPSERVCTAIALTQRVRVPVDPPLSPNASLIDGAAKR